MTTGFVSAVAFAFATVLAWEYIPPLWKELPFAIRSVFGLAMTGVFMYLVVVPVGVESGQPLHFLISAGIVLIYFAVLIVRFIQAVRWAVGKARGGAK